MRRSSVILTLAVLASAGCAGYSSQPLIDPQYKTVYVKTFDNKTFYRGFEQTLTRLFINKINQKTPLRIVPMDQAQTIITGEIVDFKQQVLTEDVNNNVRESQITVFVNMTWSDARTGKPIKLVRNLGLSDPIKFDVGQSLDTVSPELFDDMAVRLVEEIEAPW